ncbi:ABC transporter permease [Pectinatus frisingensis]|uniref:ABC transporter permease n=1 Tax=Pectinatus frisingensis TaxID=865 RepID=UPI0018C4E81C|nr:ABC transporter permease [Pectinatus frisingensis]
MNLWQIIKRELYEIFLKDPRRIIFIFGAILIYLFLFGSLYEPGIVKHVPAIIYDEDQSHLSRKLIKNIDDSETFEIVQNASSEEAMLQALDNKEVYAAIQIPRDFSKNIALGHPATVLYMVNGANLVFANTTATAAQDIINNYSDNIAINYTSLRLGLSQDILTPKIIPIHYNLRMMNNPIQTYLFFFCIGLSMTAFEQGLFFAVGASVHYDLNHLSELNGTPIYKLIFGKLLLHWSLATIAFISFLFLAGHVWYVPVKASYIKLLLLNSAFCFAVLCLGIFIAAFFITELKFVKVSLVYVVPAFIFSGYTWPLESMPASMQLMAKIFFPLTWMSNPIRDLLLSGTTNNLIQDILMLLSIGSVCLVFSVKAFNYGRKKHEQLSAKANLKFNY